MHVLVKVTRQMERYLIQVYVDGQIEPTTVFGCREALFPVLRALGGRAAHQNGIAPLRELHGASSPATIAVQLPRGDVLTYGLVLPQQGVAD
jgi:hypothetical protein